MEESANPDGPWALIDTLPLLPLDADPSHPAVRSLTTDEAQIEDGWYRLTFVDAGGALDIVEVARTVNGSLPPQPDEIRRRSKLLQRELPEEPFDPDVEDTLAALVQESAAWVQTVTWRILDPTLTIPEATLEAVPPGLVPLAMRAVRLVAERGVMTADADFVAESAQGRRLRGFTAGPYSESYFAPGDLVVKASAGGRPMMDPDAQIDAVLWALATEGAREQWIAYATGQHPPAGAVTEFDGRRWPGGYGGMTRFRAGVGPDGF